MPSPRIGSSRSATLDNRRLSLARTGATMDPDEVRRTDWAPCPLYSKIGAVGGDAVADSDAGK